MTRASTAAKVGAVWYLRYHGHFIVTAVSDTTVALTRGQGLPESYEVQLSDFLAPGSNWFQPSAATAMSAPTRHVRTTGDYMSERQRQDMRDAGRGHLVRP